MMMKTICGILVYFYTYVELNTYLSGLLLKTTDINFRESNCANKPVIKDAISKTKVKN